MKYSENKPSQAPAPRVPNSNKPMDEAKAVPPSQGSLNSPLAEKTLFWTPPVDEWRPLKKSRNSTLRIAAIGEERVIEGLKFEGELQILTPQNWRSVLRYTSPEILLVESFLVSNTGHWRMAQHSASPHHAELVSLVALARELEIPTVFWITKGHEYHEHYKHFAHHFDFVCCADPAEVERLQEEGISAEVLLPCVQPAIYNPFRHYRERTDIGLQILFDGWADIDRLGERLSVLKRLKPFGLSIIESRYELFRNRLGAVPEYGDNVLGSVTQAGRTTALRYAKSYVTLPDSLSTKTTQQWMALEAAASRTPVVHAGALTPDDMRRAFAVECMTPLDCVVEFARYHEDDLYRERVGHLGWRWVNQNHTFAHRLQAICRLAGVRHDWEEFPRVSIITPTYRKEMLKRCVATYDQIAYPNKELMIVFNGGYVPSWADVGMDEPREDVVVSQVPGELFAGAALNMGHLHATGQYCFRMDDDDLYAPNYVGDMVMQARCVDAALFGKPAAPLIFEGEDAVHVRDDGSPLVIVPLSVLQAGETWIGGNSMSGSLAFFGKHMYSDGAYGAADTDLILRLPPDMAEVIALLDPFNMAAERRNDPRLHTWKLGAQQAKANRSRLAGFSELVV